MDRAPGRFSRRRVVVLAALVVLLGGEGRHAAVEPVRAIAPALDSTCQTTPGLGRRLVERHAGRAAGLMASPGVTGSDALIGVGAAMAIDTDLLDQGAVVDMGGVIVMVDDGLGIFGTPFNSSGLRLDIVRLSKSFYAALPDDVDTIAFFANFNHVDGTFHALVQNDVSGIGIIDGVGEERLFNNAATYGSGGRLGGVIILSNLRQKPLDPAARFPTDHNTHLSLLAHEWAHKFGAFIRLGDPHTPTALLGRGDAHWCFFHDTRSVFFPAAMSALEGNRWAPSFDGNWTTQGATDGFSPLDLYLMGLFAPEEVPPFFYVDSSDAPGGCLAGPVSSPPQPPAVAVGEQRMVTIGEVVANNGPRDPDQTSSPKAFRMAMVLLARQGRFPPPDDVARLERLRQAWEPYFSVATGARATMDTASGPPVGPATTFTIVRIPADVQAGHPFRFAVLALDAAGRVATGYDGTVRFSSASDPGATLPGDVTFTPADRGYLAIGEPSLFTVGGSLSITMTDTMAPEVTGTRSRIVVELPELDICAPDDLIPLSSSTLPWGVSGGFAANQGLRFQHLIHRDEIGRPGLITSLNWNVLGGPDRVDWEDVVISMAHKRDFTLLSSPAQPPPLDQNLADSETVTQVLSGRLQRAGLIEGGRLHFRLATPFPYNGIDHLLVEMRYAGGVPPGLDTGQIDSGPELITVNKLGPNPEVLQSQVSPMCVGFQPGNTVPTVIGLAVETVSNTTSRIGWRTSPATIGRVSFGEVGAPLDRSTEFERFDVVHSIQIQGLLPGTSYEAVAESINLDNQLVTTGPVTFTTTDKRPVIASLTPETLPQGTPNTFVRVRGENFFAGLTVSIVQADVSPGVVPVPDPTVRIAAHNRISDTVLDLGVVIDADAVPGPRRLHVVNVDGFATISAGFFGVQSPLGAADINVSGRVDGFDLARLSRAFGARFGELRYDAGTDLDGDGEVDGIDLARLANRFGD